LLCGTAKDFTQRGPEAKRTIANGQIGRTLETASLEIKEQLTPALGAFAVPIGEAQDFFAAPFVRAD